MQTAQAIKAPQSVQYRLSQKLSSPLAGARARVHSSQEEQNPLRWVNDASTSLLMQQFYQQLATGKKTKAEALQLVQQQCIIGKLTTNEAPSCATLIAKGNPQTRQSMNGEFSHSLYWAPFILIGNSL